MPSVEIRWPLLSVEKSTLRRWCGIERIVAMLIIIQLRYAIQHICLAVGDKVCVLRLSSLSRKSSRRVTF